MTRSRSATTRTPARTEPNNAVRLEFTDSAAVTYTSLWSFRIISRGRQRHHGGRPVGLQRRATCAPRSARRSSYLDGPGGLTQQGTHFGTTTGLGVADIGGQPAKVMEVPGDVIRQIGYVMTHGIAPNGGGTRVNQYTLIMDVFVDTTGPGAASLLQTSSPEQHRRRRPVLAGQQLRPGHRRLQRHRHLHRRRLAPRRRRLRHGRQPARRDQIRGRHQAGRLDRQPGPRQRAPRPAPHRRPVRRRRPGRTPRDVGQLDPDPRRQTHRRRNRACSAARRPDGIPPRCRPDHGHRPVGLQLRRSWRPPSANRCTTWMAPGASPRPAPQFGTTDATSRCADINGERRQGHAGARAIWTATSATS